jgi:hypothetical protein
VLWVQSSFECGLFFDDLVGFEPFDVSSNLARATILRLCGLLTLPSVLRVVFLGCFSFCFCCLGFFPVLFRCVWVLF